MPRGPMEKRERFIETIARTVKCPTIYCQRPPGQSCTNDEVNSELGSHYAHKRRVVLAFKGREDGPRYI